MGTAEARTPPPVLPPPQPALTSPAGIPMVDKRNLFGVLATGAVR
jgi:hypothetical protein